MQLFLCLLSLKQKMTDKPLVIPIDKIKSDFQTFLAPDHNKRIIFSGPFGIGKTYFLNEFFNEKEEYFPIFLRPINYSLLSNEDVFKFIKYDILAQLIAKKKIDIDKEIEIPTSENLKSFLKNNKLLVLKNLLKIIPKLGGFSDSIDAVEELYLEYRKAKENLSTELSAEQIKIFNDDFEDHFLSEFDNVSAIIKQKIKEENKQCVLVIDDLDRLDPEHIFRLFNVFSAHFDLEGNDSNKFGFHKIIFVCDIENIRKIFAHKYGTEVDFSGYIDKFYSIRPFFINNDKYIDEYISKRLDFEGVPIEVIKFIRILISYFFINGKINLRKLENLYKESIPDNVYVDDDWIAVDSLYDVKAALLNWIRYLTIFKPLFGSFSKLIDEIDVIPQNASRSVIKSNFKEFEGIVLRTYSVLSTGHIKNTLGQIPLNSQSLKNQKFKWSIGSNSIEVYMSFQRSHSRFILYEVYLSSANVLDKDFKIYDLKTFYRVFILSGLRLNIISD